MNYFNAIVRVAHFGATVAAIVVAFGATIGFHDMTGSWPLAVLGGAGIASLLGLGWYTLITLGSRARRIAAKALTISLGILLVTVALGTSGWALATAIGGKQALADYQSRALAEHETALADAYARVNGQLDLVDVVSQHAAATRILSEEEGRTGQGPLYRSYQRTAENLDNAAEGMRGQIDAADKHYASGIQALDTAMFALGDGEVFRAAMVDVEAAITALNAVDVSGDILSVGMVGLNDRGLPELDTLTQSLRDAGETGAQEPVEVPRYVAMSRSEATLSERPVGAWIAAASIDVAPLVLLLIVMLAASEPLLREDRKPKARVTDDEIREAEDNVIGMKDAA